MPIRLAAYNLTISLLHPAVNGQTAGEKSSIQLVLSSFPSEKENYKENVAPADTRSVPQYEPPVKSFINGGSYRTLLRKRRVQEHYGINRSLPSCHSVHVFSYLLFIIVAHPRLIAVK